MRKNSADLLAILLVLITFFSVVAEQGRAQTPVPGAKLLPSVPAAVRPDARPSAFISDLHLGIGRRPDGTWSPFEDFRWSGALGGFFDALSSWGADRVDLVIVGDFLELWQPPSDVKCEEVSSEIGCSVEEMLRIVTAIVGAHRDDFALLRDFSRKGDNRLYIIPGNHDSSLLIEAVRAPIAEALGAGSGRVAFVSSGVWNSESGRIVAEHGHQIGSDANRYDTWPKITQQVGEVTYLKRPWGERFVQRIFNVEEEQYEIIDNLSPETVGVKYRLADKGLVKSASDFAKFIAFNLFETSSAQKVAALGTPSTSPADDQRRWDLIRARKEIGYKLFSEALTKDDPLRLQVEAPEPSASELRTELSNLARDRGRLPDSDVRALCDLLALNRSNVQCAVPTAGAIIESKLVPRRHVLREHLAERLRSYPKMQIFIYGHTHELEEGWSLPVTKNVRVHNTGAFQRATDENGFLRRVQAKGISPEAGLRLLKLEDLPPCYTAVLVGYDASNFPQSKTIRWHQSEGAAGTWVNPGDSLCR